MQAALIGGVPKTLCRVPSMARVPGWFAIPGLRNRQSPQNPPGEGCYNFSYRISDSDCLSQKYVRDQIFTRFKAFKARPCWGVSTNTVVRRLSRQNYGYFVVSIQN
ncbi:hypothetical protein TNCV_4826551 [Trichonephila clavipes]|nr:hypothetical protein TNCV_4826551 [Trichonephila clavipes]